MTFHSDQSSVPYASLWQRVIAFSIDVLILYMINQVISGTFKLSISTPNLQDVVVQYLVWILSGWVYFSIQESSSKRATIGKWAIGLQVTDIKGGRISFWRSTGRYFIGLLSLILSACLEPNPKHQAFHDWLAGTLVVRASSRV